MPVAQAGRLYAKLLHALTPLTPRPHESLAELVELASNVKSGQFEVDKTVARLEKEKFNRKGEINATLRKLKSSLEI